MVILPFIEMQCMLTHGRRFLEDQQPDHTHDGNMFSMKGCWQNEKGNDRHDT